MSVSLNYFFFLMGGCVGISKVVSEGADKNVVHCVESSLTFMFGTKPFFIRKELLSKRSIKEHSSLYVRC